MLAWGRGGLLKDKLPLTLNGEGGCTIKINDIIIILNYIYVILGS